MPDIIAAIDQGTTSTRCLLFDAEARILATDQREHRQITPRPGWVEHDPMEIWERTREVVAGALARADVPASRLAAVGITNQRETVVLWDRRNGQPLYNAVVWQDTRSDALCRELSAHGGQDRFRDRTGLPIATYFSGPKIRWLLDSVDGAREACRRGDALVGTIDSWLAWWLTGGPDGGRHITDVTNACRTLLFNIHTLDWDDALLDEIGVPRAALPDVRSSSEVYGRATGVLSGVPLSGILGDQQAALVGQACLARGTAKNTYGTGSFLLLNTGETPVPSQCGLLTSVGYRFGDAPPVYVLEGSIAVTGSLVQWLRDNLGLIRSAPEVEDLARTVDDHGGVYIVPAFSGLFAPHWRSDARGIIAGLTRYANKGHIARAALEATAFQTCEVVEAMQKDADCRLTELRVDGGMVANDLLMQFQADLLGVPVQRPRVTETTALGAACAAGLATGFWSSPDDLRRVVAIEKTWEPAMDPDTRARRKHEWSRAVARAMGWIEE